MGKLDNIAFGGCLVGGEPVKVDLTETVEKLCDLVDILVASDPDGDGILNIEGNISLDCQIVSEPVTGCLDGECVTGHRRYIVYKDGRPSQLIEDTLPAGASPEPCPNVIVASLPAVCCDVRQVIDTPGDVDIVALLGLGVGDTVPSFSLTVQNLGDPSVPVTITDCNGNPSTAYCGEHIGFAGGCGDQDSIIQNVTLAAGDRVVIEARVCPPSEA